ncbi:MAG: ABC transporter ATP-binding protein [Eubacteriaceae bacterium]|nr:ABC transporter ATP-binding protein [Eubacteriaceae bacterium]
MERENVIQVRDLRKEYKELTALDGISFDVKKGEILGLLGPNGSGKSTTINCLLSLISFSGGDIKILGKEMTPDAYDIKREIGVVFQDVAVFNELNVEENIEYFCGLYINDKQQRKQMVEDVIRLTGLADHRKFRPKKLSGGLLRRLNIACGIAHRPEIIFLDEPTVAVDPQSRNSILDGIVKLNDEGATIIYTSHYMEEVEQICDRIIILDKGRIIASGTKEELKDLVDIGEKISVEGIKADEEQIKRIGEAMDAAAVSYEGKVLHVRCRKGGQSLRGLVLFLEKEQMPYSRIYSELPTLNDVFLELTGKELRD